MVQTRLYSQMKNFRFAFSVFRPENENENKNLETKTKIAFGIRKRKFRFIIFFLRVWHSVAQLQCGLPGPIGVQTRVYIYKPQVQNENRTILFSFCFSPFPFFMHVGHFRFIHRFEWRQRFKTKMIFSGFSFGSGFLLLKNKNVNENPEKFRLRIQKGDAITHTLEL